MKYLKQYEDIEKKDFKKYIIIDFCTNINPRYYILRTAPNTNPKSFGYDKYYYYNGTTNTLTQNTISNGVDSLKLKDKELIFETDSEEEAIEQLKLIYTSNKYNL